MKYTIKSLALLLIIVLSISETIAKKSTPKAEDLSNHFGTNVNSDMFGPHPQQFVNLRREGVAPGVPVAPITNFHKEINPKEVTSGNFDNTSFDANKIIKPEIATPKAEINSKIRHEAVVKTPVHLGNQYEEKTITTLNRVDGKVDSKTVIVEKPIIGIKNELKNVVTDHKTVVDLSSGKLVKSNSGKSYLGI
jgi:hypothetical protein